MLQFIFVIGIASVIGVQIGIYSVLKQKGIVSGRALLFSFGIYTLPFLIASAHIELYKKRHLILQTVIKKKKLNKGKIEEYRKLIDTRKFLLFTIVMAVKDVVTPKDNLILLITITEVYNRKYMGKQSNLLERFGIVGMLAKATGLIRGDLVTHASNQVFGNQFEQKHA